MATPPYERIVADLSARIRSGELPAGARVPSTRRLIADYGVAMATASKALSALRRDGLVYPVRGVGTVVAGPTGSAGAQPTARQRSGSTAGREDVVRAAVALADAEGLAGVSMRRIAASLGIATMSVYRHVRSRDELVTSMLDRVLAEHPLPAAAPEGWRARAETSARLLWAACRSHPWLAHALSMSRPQLIPHGMDHTEWLLAALDGYELDVDTRMHIAVTLLGHVRGAAMDIEPERRARQDTGLTDEEWMTAQKPALATVADPARYPHLAQAVHTEVDVTIDSLFEFGLRRFLDGLSTFLDPLPQGPRR